jgi:hypothetical protein
LKLSLAAASLGQNALYSAGGTKFPHWRTNARVVIFASYFIRGYPEPLMSEVTRILSAIEQGDPHAAEQLLPLVYEELRRLAAQKLAQEKPERGRVPRAEAYVADTDHLRRFLLGHGLSFLFDEHSGLVFLFAGGNCDPREFAAGKILRAGHESLS